MSSAPRTEVVRGRLGAPRGLAVELLLAFLFFLFYSGVRAVTQGSADRAFDNANVLQGFEDTVGLNWEPNLQGAVLGHHWIVTAANWMYIWGHWPVIATIAVVLFWKRPDVYRFTRTAFFISGAIGVTLFALFPVAPPRLADPALVDTVEQFSGTYRAFQPSSVTNVFAAFPSLHVGWNLLMGIVLFKVAHRMSLRAFGLLMPLLMASAVVLTANHFIIDVVGGALTIAIALAIAGRLCRPRTLAHPTGMMPRVAICGVR